MGRGGALILLSPAERVAEAVQVWGAAAAVAGCARLAVLAPGAVPEGDDLELALLLGGRPDRDWLGGGKPPGHAYWARVWALRGLLYAWSSAAEPAVVAALTDEMWRVREMAARVVLRRELGAAAADLHARCDDAVPRVRIAAVRALGTLGEAEDAEAVRALWNDDDPKVRAAVVAALRRMSNRLDRELG